MTMHGQEEPEILIPGDPTRVSVFTNDFGDLYDVPTKGQGDWEEGKYWLDQIAQFCRSRQWPLV